MKKLFAFFIAPLSLAACGNLNGMNGDFASGSDAGLQEESLNNSVKNDYAQSRALTDAAAPATDGLVYAGPKYYLGT